MYVTRLQLDGIRGFHGPRAVDLDFTRPDGSYAGWTVLAGRNGSGKTTLLRAIAACLAGEKRAMQLDGELDAWLTEGMAEGRVQVWLDAGPGRPEEYARITWSPEQALFASEDFPAPTDVGFSGSSQVRLALWSSAPSGFFQAAYGPFRRLSGGGVFERSRRGAGRIASMRTLFQEDAALTEAVDWLVELHLYRLEGRDGAQELLDAVVELLNHDLLPDAYAIEKVDSDGPWLRRTDGAGPLLPLPRMSHGFRAVVTLVLDIVRHMHTECGELSLGWREEGDGPVPYLPYSGVVLIDEIDAHLHVSWQQRIGEWFKAHFPAVQFIVTTHSPYICQAADEGGLIRLSGAEQPLPPQVVPEELWKRIVYGTGDDAVLSDLFGLDTPYSDEAQELRRELVQLEARVVTDRATPEEEARHSELREQLKSSPGTRVAEVDARLRALGVFDE